MYIEYTKIQGVSKTLEQRFINQYLSHLTMQKRMYTRSDNVHSIPGHGDGNWT
jgi:hypothetical protein